LTNCDGSTSEVLSTQSCLVPITLLIDSSYQLAWGSSIYAKVSAYNLYGYSVESAVGNGAIILTYPDAPVSLAETISERTSSSITISWSEGAANGGTDVLDYRVTYDQSNDDYLVLVSELNALTYTAIGLTAGNTYKFKVEARNSYGYSAYSDIVAILCA
jgi:hypothetical protein